VVVFRDICIAEMPPAHLQILKLSLWLTQGILGQFSWAVAGLDRRPSSSATEDHSKCLTTDRTL
jgi:hypothetical protein